jgi:hypothetical protein
MFKKKPAASNSYSNSLRSFLASEIVEEDKQVEKYPMPVKRVSDY